jgi:hypothetical protein
MSARLTGTGSERDRAWRDSRGLGSRRLRTAAFGFSVALHLVAVVLYASGRGLLSPERLVLPLVSDQESDQGVDLIQLIEIDAGDPDRPENPDEIEDVQVAEADARPPYIPGPLVGELLPPGPSAAERLRVNLVDPRLWAALPPEFYQLTLEEREELLLSQRIVEWFDSVAIARASEDRLTDWMFRDGQGGRWGVADGRIYLGDMSLPLPFDFGVPVGKRDEYARRIWEFDEITRQSQQYLIDQNWKERAEAIRQRRDRERAAAAARDTVRIR